MININVNDQGIVKTYKMKSSQTISDLKTKIEVDHMPKGAQHL
jgi:hypothetical protein